MMGTDDANDMTDTVLDSLRLLFATSMPTSAAGSSPVIISAVLL